jgi:hypothetical protein
MAKPREGATPRGAWRAAPAAKNKLATGIGVF